VELVLEKHGMEQELEQQPSKYTEQQAEVAGRRTLGRISSGVLIG
jgi:hypothetical protein